LETPLVSIVKIESTGNNSFVIIFYNTYFRFFINLHFHTRQTGRTLRELHIAGEQVDLEVVGQRKNKLTGIQIITSENEAASARLKSDVQSIVKQGKYELLMQVDEDDQKVRIYHREGKKQSAVVMMADEDGEFAVIVFSGTFTLDDVQKMTK
jgi:hypothetical protein